MQISRTTHPKQDLLRSDDGHLLVLDAPDGGLAACAMLEIEDHRGHLTLLAVAPGFEGLGIEDRMFGVVEVMYTAFGADTIDIVKPDAA